MWKTLDVCSLMQKKKGKTEHLPKGTCPGVRKKTVQDLEMEQLWVLLLQHWEAGVRLTADARVFTAGHRGLAGY